MKTKLLPEYCFSQRSLLEVGGAVLHYFSGRNVDPERQFDMDVCYNLFLDLNRARNERQFYMLGEKWPDKRMYASAHVLIGQDGETWKLVEFDRQAHHAGQSIMNGRPDCNNWTIGIELVGDSTSGFSKAQYQALVAVLDNLEQTYGFSRDNVQGHDRVRWAAIQNGSRAKAKYDPSGRKDGEGSNFDWWYFGKMWNDLRANPAGTVGVEHLDEILEAHDADPTTDTSDERYRGGGGAIR